MTVNKLNDLTLYAIARTDAWLESLTQEDGSQGIEAAGAALAAMTIVIAVKGGAEVVAKAVKAAMAQAASVLGG